MIAFVFPGQGSQAVGMGQALYEAFPAARDVIQQVNDALSQNLSKLMFEGPLELLTQTQNAQPALLAVSLAVVRTLEKEGGFDIPQKVHVLAGHSVGEYSAFVAAGVLKLPIAAEFLRLRGQAMQQAVPPGEGAMAALLGLSLEQLQELPQPASEVCVIANDNAPGQVVISGHKGAVEKAIAWAKTLGAKGIMLNVGGPFHSPLMESAQEVMAEVLGKGIFSPPSVPIITNMSATPQRDPLVLQNDLIRQLTGRVRWRETMETMIAMGITQVVEVGAGGVLSGLARRSMPNVESVRLETPQDIELFLSKKS